MATYSWLDETTSTTSSSGTMSIYCSAATTFSNIKIKVAPSANTTNVAFHLVLKDSVSGKTYTTDSVVLDGTIRDITEIKTVDTPFISSSNSTVTIQFVSEKSCKHERVAITVDNKVLKGAGAYVATTWAFAMAVEATAQVWQINNKYETATLIYTPFEIFTDWARRINGRAINTSIWYIDPVLDIPVLSSMFTDSFDSWTRDKWGYPINPTIWRIDHNNLGFPWIWGYVQREVVANLTIQEEGKLQIKKHGKISIKK